MTQITYTKVEACAMVRRFVYSKATYSVIMSKIMNRSTFQPTHKSFDFFFGRRNPLSPAYASGVQAGVRMYAQEV